MLSRKRINLTNTSSRSIESFFSVNNEKVDGGKAVQKKQIHVEADLDGEMVLFALLSKISSIVYKKGCSLSASNKLPFSFP